MQTDNNYSMRELCETSDLLSTDFFPSQIIPSIRQSNKISIWFVICMRQWFNCAELSSFQIEKLPFYTHIRNAGKWKQLNWRPYEQTTVINCTAFAFLSPDMLMTFIVIWIYLTFIINFIIERIFEISRCMSNSISQLLQNANHRQMIYSYWRYQFYVLS